MSEQKRAYKAALKDQLDVVKSIPGAEFPTEGIITLTFNIETGEVESTISGGSTRDGDGGTGGTFPWYQLKTK